MAVRIRPEHAARLSGIWRSLIDPPARVLDPLSLRDGEKILDLGAGPGHHTIPAARKVGDSGLVVAVEVEPGVALKLEGRLSKYGIDNVRILRKDAESLVLERQTFDAALLCMVLHETDLKTEVLNKVKEALKPGGRLEVVEFLPGSFWGPPPEHRVSEAALLNLLTETGFRDIRTLRLDRNRYCMLASRGYENIPGR